MGGLLVSSVVATVVALVVHVVAAVAISVLAIAELGVVVHVVRHGLLDVAVLAAVVHGLAVVHRLLGSGSRVLRLVVGSLIALLLAHNVVVLRSLGHRLNWNLAVGVRSRVHGLAVVHGGGFFGFLFVEGVGHVGHRHGFRFVHANLGGI